LLPQKHFFIDFLKNLKAFKIIIFEKTFALKKIICCLCVCYAGIGFAQSKSYFQQRADHHIKVSLDPELKTLTGNQTIHYQNNSSDTLKFIWFHIWPNAYKNDKTAFSEQFLQNGNTSFYFSDDEKRGYINQLNFKVDEMPATLEDHPFYIDVVRLVLPQPLAPNHSVNISCAFHVKLPYLFSRSGYMNDEFLITQWYPKPAVYDNNGWHEMPYLDQGEFYSEYGDYQVEINLPAQFDVAATGSQTKKEKEGKMKTLTYTAENIHDFAWFAFKDFVEEKDSMVSINGHTIILHVFYNNDSPEVWKDAIQMMKDAVSSRERWMGAYPYNSLTVVQGPEGFSIAMEYPTITVISPETDKMQLDEVINHEIGHNWNYGVLGNNERQHAWLDEGINTYYTNRYMFDKYGPKAPCSGIIEKRLPADPIDLVYRTIVSQKKDQPIETPSSAFSETNYYVTAYHKTALWLHQLSNYIGQTTFDSAMHIYYQDFKYRHPSPENLKSIFESVSEKNLDSLFNLLNTKGDVVPRKKKSLKPALLFNFNHTEKYNYIFLSPAAGYNFYDKLMIGGLLHNYTLPEPAFHFFIAPVYATGSKSFTGMGRIGFSKTTYGWIRQAEVSVSAAHFNMDSFTDSTGTKNFMNFSKFVPAVKFTFRNKNYRSHANSYVQWKTYFISEQSLLFTRDTIQDIDIITYPQTDRYLNELSFVKENDRELYPYRFEITGQQGDGFVRLGSQLNYYFNYAKGGGLNMRLFAGKFIYLTDKTLYNRYALSRYHFTMTGPKGNEDYTYSNYFIGRNEFEGMPSHQIMIRDGGFKVRTDLLANKIGKTDNWLAAMNLNTSVPKSINPLRILPFKVDLKAFLEIGTYAEAWDKNSTTGKFLYDAGLQLSLLKGLVNVYAPLLYSNVYSDYFKSTIPKNKRFITNISFSIDIQKFRLREYFNLGY